MSIEPCFVVSIHDVAPASAEATRQWLADLDARGVPATLLVIAGPWRGPELGADRELIANLHAAAAGGHELSSHGWSHRASTGGTWWRQRVGQVVARGAAEFCALDEATATERLSRSLDSLRAVGIDPIGFTPPGWLASPGAAQAAGRLGLRYVTSHLAVHDLVAGRRLPMPALSHRPGGRGERFGGWLMGVAVRRRTATGRPFRIALHPDDLTRPRLREITLAAIDFALASGARPVTYAALVGASS